MSAQTPRIGAEWRPDLRRQCRDHARTAEEMALERAIGRAWAHDRRARRSSLRRSAWATAGPILSGALIGTAIALIRALGG